MGKSSDSCERWNDIRENGLASFLKQLNLIHSTLRCGNCHNNASTESFLNLLKRERELRNDLPIRGTAQT